jgi:ABC-type nitrate/sulfonate/bicarbonate transport system permease component
LRPETVLLPTPLQAAQAFVQLARDGNLIGNAVTSLRSTSAPAPPAVKAAGARAGVHTR